MDIIGTSKGISKTIKNVSRLKEIVTIFAKHGLGDFVSMGVISAIPNFVLPKSSRSLKSQIKEKDKKDWIRTLSSKLRICFEELGPVFIKFGQLLATRDDMFDSIFIDEMRLLKSKVKSIDFNEVKEQVEKSLGESIDNIFTDIDYTPIGVASIGIVYQGKLKNGDNIVIKVRYPDIEDKIETDFNILNFLVSHIEKIGEELKYFIGLKILKDFYYNIKNETNFFLEANNYKIFSKVLKEHDKNNVLYIPKVYTDYTREDLLVIEKISGIPFIDTERILAIKDELNDKMLEGFKTFIMIFLKNGFYHGDLHEGNFFYLDNGKIALIDFGLMGRLSKQARYNFIAIICAILTSNYENLTYEFLDVADYDSIPDVDTLINDIRDSLSPYVGLTTMQTNFPIMIKRLLKTLYKHKIYFPREWYMIFRSLVVLDGIKSTLNQDFDLFEIMNSNINDVLENNLNKENLAEEVLWSARDILPILRIFPRYLKWFIKDWAKKGYTFNLNICRLEKSFIKLSNSFTFIGFALLSSSFLIGSMIIFDYNIKIFFIGYSLNLSYIFQIFSALFLLYGIIVLKRSK